MARPPHQYMQLLCVYILIFLHMLDTTVVNLLLVRMAPDLAVDVQDSAWIITSFGSGLLVSFGFTGLISRFIEPRTTFVAANVVFALASIACGLVFDPYLFFGARLLQGFSSGLVVSVSYPILMSLFGREDTAKATSVWVSAISLAPVVGPVYGALISELWGWHWAFLINAPLVILCLMPLMSFVSLKVQQARIKNTFVWALCCYAVTAFSFQFALDLGAQSDWRLDRTLLILIAIFVGAAVLFVQFNRRCGYQVLETALLGHYRFAGFILIIGTGTGIIFASMVLLPIWLQLDYGFSIIQAGLIVAVSSLTAALVSPLLGHWIKAQQLTWAAGLSLLLVFASFVVTSTHRLETALWVIIIGRLLLGCGLALFSVSLTTLMMTSVGPDRAMSATAFNMSGRVFASNIFATAVIYGYKVLNQYHYGVYQATAVSIYPQENAQDWPLVLNYFLKVVHTLSVNHVFKLLTLLCFLLLVLFLGLQWRTTIVARQQA